MTFGRIVHVSKDKDLLRALGALAACVVLMVIAYGIAKPPEGALLSLSATAVAGPASTTVTVAATRDGTLPGPPAFQSRFAASDLPLVRVDAPRECAPDVGLTDACVFE